MIAAIGAINVVRMDRVLAAGTVQTQILAALRAVTVVGENLRPAMRAQSRQRLPQKEIQDDAEPVRNADSQQSPDHPPHASPSSIAVHIANQQEVAAHEQCA